MLCAVVLFYSGELCVLRVPCSQPLARLSNLHFIQGLFQTHLPTRTCRAAGAARRSRHVLVAYTLNIALLHWASYQCNTSNWSSSSIKKVVQVKLYFLCAFLSTKSIFSICLVLLTRASFFYDNWSINSNKCQITAVKNINRSVKTSTWSTQMTKLTGGQAG